MFKVTPHENKPLIWWYEQRSKINMSPTYQRRGSLWSRQKKSLLIDSVLNEYDIPKIYLTDFTHAYSSLNEKKSAYAVIDGQQRLETFFEFFEGRVKLPDDFVFAGDEELDLRGISYAGLRKRFPAIARRFESYVPPIMSVITDEEQKIDELFVRLNSGLAVNAAERRNAMPGPVPGLIRKIVAHTFFSSRISFNIRRMAEYNAAAKIVLIEFRDKFVDTKAGNLDRFVKENIETPPNEFEPTMKIIVAVLDEMSLHFRERDPLLSTTGPIPLYYWFVRNRQRHLNRFRPFIEEFSKEIKLNLEISRDRPDDADPELSSYYTMGRTTNDQSSLSKRYEILEKRFQAFLKQKG